MEKAARIIIGGGGGVNLPGKAVGRTGSGTLTGEYWNLGLDTVGRGHSGRNLDLENSMPSFYEMSLHVSAARVFCLLLYSLCCCHTDKLTELLHVVITVCLRNGAPLRAVSLGLAHRQGVGFHSPVSATTKKTLNISSVTSRSLQLSRARLQ